MPQSRRLAAIMFTDIVGYTSLMADNEKRAFEILKTNRLIHKPTIGQYNGLWIKELGDGVMASFDNPLDAVNAASAIMESCNSRNEYQLRIGIHVEEVVFENEDVFGNGVNIAARIQSAAKPGCIFISEDVHKSICINKHIDTHYLGEQKLKNVSNPVKLFQVLVSGSIAIFPDLPEPLVPENSIAVLPFANMSGDPEQEYLSDGISEEIINMLAQVPGLKVISRTSCFSFKGKNQGIQEIGEQLKVSHILDGSLRKSGNRLRITAQLIKVEDGFYVYSEKFDRELEDIFAIQDEISLAILNAIKLKLLGKEKEAVLKKYTDNIEAYELYLRARFHVNKFIREGFLKAIEFFDAAIAIDPEYAIAYSGKAFCYLNLTYFNWLPSDMNPAEGLKSALQSLRLDDQIAESHLAVGRIKLFIDWKISEAAIEFRKALDINPNNAECHVQLGMCLILHGHMQEAMEHAIIAESLDPLSILNLWYLNVIPWAAGEYDIALKHGNKLIDLEPNFFSGHFWNGLAYLELRRYDEAIEELTLTAKLNPSTFTLGHLGMAYGMKGMKKKAKEIISEMEGPDGVDYGGNHFIGNIYAIIGDWDTALLYFEKAVKLREGHVLWIQYDLQQFPEFLAYPKTRALIKSIGLH